MVLTKLIESFYRSSGSFFGRIISLVIDYLYLNSLLELLDLILQYSRPRASDLKRNLCLEFLFNSPKRRLWFQSKKNKKQLNKNIKILQRYSLNRKLNDHLPLGIIRTKAFPFLCLFNSIINIIFYFFQENIRAKGPSVGLFLPPVMIGRCRWGSHFPKCCYIEWREV